MDKQELYGKNWAIEECYLAVWGYDLLDKDRDYPKKDLYSYISDITGRTEKSVEFKIANVSFYDPRPREEKPISEYSHAQKLLEKVFKWYWSDREFARGLLPKYAELVKKGFINGTDFIEKHSEGYYTNFLIEEGSIVLSNYSRHKRSKELFEEGRAYFKSIDPEKKLRCLICGFTAPKEIKCEIIELHHLEPISEYGNEGKKMSFVEAIKKIVPLCPTCHKLVHSAKPPFDVDEIKHILNSTKKQA